MIFKQVIVLNKELGMSPGKAAAMVAHGATAFFEQWFKNNIDCDCSTWTDYVINSDAKIEKDLFAKWIAGDNTTIILEAENQEEMVKIVEKAKENGMWYKRDFFHIIDCSTEFGGIPRWAAIAFKPMRSDLIDNITGKLKLYNSE